MRARPAPAILVVLACACACACGGRGERGDAGSAIRLDGDGDHALVGRIEATAPLSLGGAPFTVAAWFLQEPGGDPYQRIVDKSDGLFGQNGWAVSAHGPSGQIHLYAHDGRAGGDFVSRRGAYRTGRWHHVAAVARAHGREIWIDGVRDRGAFYEDGGDALPAAAATELRLGSWNHAGGRAWKGLLGPVAVWGRDLGPEEIAALARGGGRLDLLRDGDGYAGSGELVAWWVPEPDWEGTGQVRDRSQTGAHATIVRE